MRITALVLLVASSLALAPAVATAEEWRPDPARATLEWDGERLPARLVAVDRRPVVVATGDELVLRAGADRFRVRQLRGPRFEVSRLGADGAPPAWTRILATDVVNEHAPDPGLTATIARFGPRDAEARRPERVRAHLVVSIGRAHLVAAIDVVTGLVAWQIPWLPEHIRHRAHEQTGEVRILRVRGRGRRARLRRSAWLATAPRVVSTPSGYRVLVGVTEERVEDTAASLADSRLYEIDETGAIVAMSALHRPIVEPHPATVPGAWLLVLEDGATVRVEPSFQEVAGWKGLGSTTRRCHIAWLADHPESRLRGLPVQAGDAPDAWLSALSGRPSGHAHADTLLRVVPRCTIDRPTDGTWQVGILRQRAGEGISEAMATLRVPGVGTATLPADAPEANPEGPRHVLWTRNRLWVHGLRSSGASLVVEVATDEGTRHALAFEVPGGASATPPAALPAARPVAVRVPTRGTRAAVGDPLGRRSLPSHDEHELEDPASLAAAIRHAEREGLPRDDAIESAVWQLGPAALPADVREDAVRLLARWGNLGWLLAIDEVVARDRGRAATLLAQIAYESPDVESVVSYAYWRLLDLDKDGERLASPVWFDAALDLAGPSASTWRMRDLLHAPRFDSDDEATQAARARAHVRGLAAVVVKGSPAERVVAAMALSDAPTDEAPNALLPHLVPCRTGAAELLGAPTLRARRAGAVLAAELCRRMPDEASALAPTLVAALETDDEDVGDFAMAGLRRLGPHAASSMPALITIAPELAPALALRVPRVLVACSDPSSRATRDALAEWAADKSRPDLAAAARQALERLLAPEDDDR